jgi:hypothetical protein
MTLDIRIPIGLLFLLIGALLMVQGLIVDHAPRAAGVALNVNAWWGLVLLVFGGAMLLFARRRTPHG